MSLKFLCWFRRAGVHSEKKFIDIGEKLWITSILVILNRNFKEKALLEENFLVRVAFDSIKMPSPVQSEVVYFFFWNIQRLSMSQNQYQRHCRLPFHMAKVFDRPDKIIRRDFIW